MQEIILGLDPGTRRAGYGLVAVQGDVVQHIAHGVISMPESRPLAERLCQLQDELHNVFERYPVSATVVEKIFLGRNVDSAFKLGHARGVCMLMAARQKVPVFEYAARYVKKCITGSGAADKEHVQLVVFNLLRVQAKNQAFDASDALSLAVTHARVREVHGRLARAQREGEL